MHKITFYVPTEDLDRVKNALFAKGAGKFGGYECCAWQTLGTGQFRPLPGSNPHIGSENQIETVEEYLVEMICPDDILSDVIDELFKVHPYETPAYATWKIDQHDG